MPFESFGLLGGGGFGWGHGGVLGQLGGCGWCGLLVGLYYCFADRGQVIVILFGGCVQQLYLACALRRGGLFAYYFLFVGCSAARGPSVREISGLWWAHGWCGCVGLCGSLVHMVSFQLSRWSGGPM